MVFLWREKNTEESETSQNFTQDFLLLTLFPLCVFPDLIFLRHKIQVGKLEINNIDFPTYSHALLIFPL